MPKRKKIKHQGGAPKTYLRRLPKAIVALQAFEGDKFKLWGPPYPVIGHFWISEHLGVSKATAIRILNAAGGEFLGNSLVVNAAGLRAYFERLIQSPHAVPEMRRLTRTAKQLTEMARYMSQRQSVIGDKRIKRSVFQNLEKNDIVFTRSNVLITFNHFDDFLRKFAMVVYALQNDFDEMRQYLDTSSRDKS